MNLIILGIAICYIIFWMWTGSLYDKKIKGDDKSYMKKLGGDDQKD
ncbi:hypothetical protein KKG22_04275 [Patescibacteria group bacterium]|nr:hypothetical protein [Patescibacteria group bacterium]